MTGHELMEMALRVKEKYGVQKAIAVMVEHGVSREMATIALVGANRARRFYDVNVRSRTR